MAERGASNTRLPQTFCVSFEAAGNVDLGGGKVTLVSATSIEDRERQLIEETTGTWGWLFLDMSVVRLEAPFAGKLVVAKVMDTLEIIWTVPEGGGERGVEPVRSRAHRIPLLDSVMSFASQLS